VSDDIQADADEELAVVRAAQVGDGVAFLRLATSYRPRLVAFLARLSAPYAVALDEVAQKALDDAYEGLPRLRDPAGFRPWLFTIARRRLLDALSDHERTVSLDALVVPLLLPSSDLPSDLTDLIDVFEEASLSQEVRTMLLLRGRGYTPAEIAVRVGKTTVAVERALGRARQALRVLLQEKRKKDDHA